MADDIHQGSSGEQSQVRFEATVHARDDTDVDVARLADLDVDRVPGPAGEVRVLVNMDDCVRLLAQDFEIRLLGAVPARPLDRELIADDDAVRVWFEERIRPTGRAGAA